MLRRSERRWMQLVAGVLLALVGLVWALQGAGVLPGSVMSGEREWLVIGTVVVVVGAALAARAWRA
jgi:hypothetical protein